MGEIEQKILDYARLHTGMSFVEIEKIFQASGFEYKGGYAVMPARKLLETFGQISYWYGWNKAAIDVLTSLLHSHQLIMKPSSAIVYAIDGKAPNFPEVKAARFYETEHWVPVEFNVSKN